MKTRPERELYDRAYFAFENGRREEALELASALLRDHPESREAGWARWNLPVIWDPEQQRALIDEDALQATDKSIIFLLSLVVFFVMFFLLLRGSFYDWLIPLVPSSDAAAYITSLVCFFFSGIAAGLAYRERAGEGFRGYLFISFGLYAGMFYVLVMSLIVIQEVITFSGWAHAYELKFFLANWYLPIPWLFFSFLGVNVGRAIRVRFFRRRKAG